MVNYYISDLHLFHKNVTEEGNNFDNRPFKTIDEMHETIKNNWNAAVTNSDHVYILGDLAWKENEEAIALISTLRGNKHLILGNHDRAKDYRFQQLFVEITNYKELKDNIDGDGYDVILSHYPIAFWNHQHHCKNKDGVIRPTSVHLYGHVHDNVEEKYFQNFIMEVNNSYGIKCSAKNVGCMMPYMNYTPRTLKDIMEANNV